MTSFSPREIVFELDRCIAGASAGEAVQTENPTMKAARGLCQ